MRRVRFDPFGDTYENIDVMKSLTRRNIVSALLASTALSAAMGPLSAQTQPQGQSQNAARNKPAAPRTMFAYDDVVRRARELSTCCSVYAFHRRITVSTNIPIRCPAGCASGS